MIREFQGTGQSKPYRVLLGVRHSKEGREVEGSFDESARPLLEMLSKKKDYAFAADAARYLEQMTRRE